jgi:hypothetical protein
LETGESGVLTQEQKSKLRNSRHLTDYRYNPGHQCTQQVVSAGNTYAHIYVSVSRSTTGQGFP